MKIHTYKIIRSAFALFHHSTGNAFHNTPRMAITTIKPQFVFAVYSAATFRR